MHKLFLHMRVLVMRGLLYGPLRALRRKKGRLLYGQLSFKGYLGAKTERKFGSDPFVGCPGRDSAILLLGHQDRSTSSSSKTYQ